MDHEKYFIFENRLNTLKYYFSEVKTFELAREGFYFHNEKLICVFCKITFNFCDNIHKEHAEQSPECFYVRLSDDQDIVVNNKCPCCGDRYDHEWQCDIEMDTEEYSNDIKME